MRTEVVRVTISYLLCRDSTYVGLHIGGRGGGGASTSATAELPYMHLRVKRSLCGLCGRNDIIKSDLNYSNAVVS